MIKFHSNQSLLTGNTMNGTAKNEQLKRIRNIILLSCLIVILIGLFYILTKIGISIPCIFNKITGLLCPGCGNTRAAISLIKGDIVAAFSYNALFPVEFFYIAWVFIISSVRYIKGKRFSYVPPCQWLDIVILIMVSVWTVVRNILLFI